MRTNIIEDLRSYYLDQHVKIHQMLSNNKMKQICDAYFKERLTYVKISERFDMTIDEVSKLMITACGLIIRNRYATKAYV